MTLSSFPGESPNWLELPRDIVENIFQRIDTIQIATSVCQVCPLWWDICKNPSLWRALHLRKSYNSPYDFVKICHFAIQRSCDRLEEIDLIGFVTDDLIKCIAENGSRLRRLHLINFQDESDKVLMDAAKHFPLLEELNITFCTNGLSKNTLEAIGLSCPLLKTLKYFRYVWPGQHFVFNEEGVAIAKTMHELRHLEIFVDELTGVGLVAILDGCPLLESLTINCYNNLISKRLRKRCQKQIKSFSLHYDDDDIVLF